MNSYLIIGASGCIGFETAKWLLQNREGEKVVTLSRGKTEFPGQINGNIHETGDISDSDSILKVLEKHNISHVVHCAALRTSDCNENPDRAREINVGGTQNVIHACEKSAGVKEFLFLSTAAVYDQVKEQIEGVTEESPVSKYAPYVTTKLESEEFIKSHAVSSDITFTIIRPQIFFGPTRSLSGSTAGVTMSIRAAAFNKEYNIPYSGKYSFHYTGDAGALLGKVLISEKDYKCEIFNLPGNSHNVADFKEILDSYNSGKSLISVSEKQYPFAKSASYEKYIKVFKEVNLSSLEKAVKETYKHFSKNRF